MSDILYRPATGIARSLRRREISSREVTEALLARIDAVNPELNAVVELRGDDAMKAAAIAGDAIASGEALGPLHGVPMTIKESFNVAGMHTTWGNPAFADYVATEDATLVERVRRAGAIIVGKSNVPTMLADNQTGNPIHGVTNNPWDTSLTPGGSSGGGAAALAAGMTFLEFGSDLSGSIRNPASFCGVYGLRPTIDVVPITGHQPPMPPPEPLGMQYLLTLGLLARSAADLRTALNAVAGPEGPLANAYTWELPAPRHRRIADYRVGFVLDHERAPVLAEPAAVLSDAVDALAGAGVTLIEGAPDGVDLGEQFSAFGDHVQAFLQPGGIDRPDRMRAREAWSRYFRDVDVFLSPANFTTATPHDERPFEHRTVATPAGERQANDLFFWTAPAAIAGLPAVVAPVGLTPGGLPVAAQVAGPHYEDDTAITFVALLAEVVGGFRRPPT